MTCYIFQAMGMSLYAIYSIAGILVLINMLIAMMSTSFANVQVHYHIIMLCGYPDRSSYKHKVYTNY